MKNNIYTICNESLIVFQNKKDAMSFYNYCCSLSEGAERERYVSVLMNLNNDSYAKDNVTTYCNSIDIYPGDHRSRSIRYQVDNLSVEETIALYEKRLKPILEVSAKYGINFYSEIPFEDFDSDDSIIMFSFSDYYQELLEKFDIDVENIETKGVSDGKYEMLINKNLYIDVRAWDKFDAVVDNVNSIIDYIKKEELTK